MIWDWLYNLQLYPPYCSSSSSCFTIIVLLQQLPHNCVKLNILITEICIGMKIASFSITVNQLLFAIKKKVARIFMQRSRIQMSCTRVLAAIIVATNQYPFLQKILDRFQYTVYAGKYLPRFIFVPFGFVVMQQANLE